MCYRVEGPDDGEPVVLISGLGMDLTSWPAAFVDGLAASGYRVILPDNRDTGRSSRMATPTPSLLDQALGRPVPGAYRVEDMAADVVALLDHLGVGRAHIVGMSLGGMIAQSVAAHYPERALTLTSMISTTGARKTGAAALSTKRRFAARPPRTRDEFIRARVGMMRHLAGRTHPADTATDTAAAAVAWERGNFPDGGSARSRQLGAINASQDRTRDLARITAPTLVIHGDRDPIVHPSGERQPLLRCPLPGTSPFREWGITSIPPWCRSWSVLSPATWRRGEVLCRAGTTRVVLLSHSGLYRNKVDLVVVQDPLLGDAGEPLGIQLVLAAELSQGVVVRLIDPFTGDNFGGSIGESDADGCRLGEMTVHADEAVVVLLKIDQVVPPLEIANFQSSLFRCLRFTRISGARRRWWRQWPSCAQFPAKIRAGP